MYVNKVSSFRKIFPLDDPCWNWLFRKLFLLDDPCWNYLLSLKRPSFVTYIGSHFLFSNICIPQSFVPLHHVTPEFVNRYFKVNYGALKVAKFFVLLSCHFGCFDWWIIIWIIAWPAWFMQNKPRKLTKCDIQCKH